MIFTRRNIDVMLDAEEAVRVLPLLQKGHVHDSDLYGFRPMNLISPRLSINIGKNITKLWQRLDGYLENIGKHCKILKVLN